MEIKASCSYDFKTTKALTHASIYKKIKPSKWLTTILILGAIFIALTIFLIVASEPGEDLSSYYSTCILFVISMLLLLYIHFLLPKLYYRNLSKFKQTENQYLFTDKEITQTSSNSAYGGNAKMEYSMIFKVIETSEYLFIFITRTQAWAVDKSTFENGSVEDVRNVLKNYLGKKYIICKY